MTEADEKALAVCRELVTLDGTFTATELGERLWGTGHRNRQCYARPAGKVIKRLKAAGMVTETQRRWAQGRMRGAWAVCR